MELININFQNIHKSYPVANGRHVVIDDITFEVPQGSITTIFGPNGCGKSTLVNILSGLDSADRGMLGGHDQIKQNLGLVFQDYRKSLLPWLTVEENILFPLRLRGVSKSECATQLDRLITITDFTVDRRQRVGTLSGGQAQMVCLMRALIIDPKLLILDEPFSALDYERTLSLRQKVMEIAATLKLTVLFISHDLEEALYLGDQVIFLSRSPTKVETILKVPFARPRMPELLGTIEFSRLKLEALQVFRRSIGGGLSDVSSDPLVIH